MQSSPTRIHSGPVFSRSEAGRTALLVMYLTTCLVFNNISAFSKARAHGHCRPESLKGTRAVGARGIDAVIGAPRLAGGLPYRTDAGRRRCHTVGRSSAEPPPKDLKTWLAGKAGLTSPVAGADQINCRPKIFPWRAAASSAPWNRCCYRRTAARRRLALPIARHGDVTR